MFYFIMALRARETTNNWERVIDDFNCTLKSVFKQTCPDFKVIVACNELPNLNEEYDDRIEIIVNDLEIPKNHLEMCRDRYWKMTICARRIWEENADTLRRGNGIFVFPIDADDLVSNKIVAYVKDHPNSNGFKSKLGYRWDKNRKYFEKTKWFGGRMNVFKLYEKEFPNQNIDNKQSLNREVAIDYNYKYPFRWDDCEVEEKFRLMGRPFDRFPFRSTVYVINTGDNISEQVKKNSGSGIMVRINKLNPFRYRALTKTMKQEYGIE